MAVQIDRVLEQIIIDAHTNPPTRLSGWHRDGAPRAHELIRGGDGRPGGNAVQALCMPGHAGGDAAVGHVDDGVVTVEAIARRRLDTEVEDTGPRFVGVEDHRVHVGCVDSGEPCRLLAECRDQRGQLWILQTLDVVLDVVAAQLATIVERDTLLQVELECRKVVGDVPALGANRRCCRPVRLNAARIRPRPPKIDSSGRLSRRLPLPPRGCVIQWVACRPNTSHLGNRGAMIRVGCRSAATRPRAVRSQRFTCFVAEYPSLAPIFLNPVTWVVSMSSRSSDTGAPRVEGAERGLTSSVPVPLTSVIGRQVELEDARRALVDRHVRLLTLTGAPGVGKTRLALAVAEVVHTAFQNGACFVPLAALRRPELVVPTIAQVLGVRNAGRQAPLGTLTQRLRDQQLLLVLDNFEHLLSAAASMVELLAACRHVTLLVTSRAPLHVSGEHRLDVGPLALPTPEPLPSLTDLAQVSSVQLLIERATAASPGFTLSPANARSVAELCARLDGLPLAIELASARCRLLEPAELLARLDTRLTLLSDGPRDAPGTPAHIARRHRMESRAARG